MFEYIIHAVSLCMYLLSLLSLLDTRQTHIHNIYITVCMYSLSVRHIVNIHIHTQLHHQTKQQNN